MELDTAALGVILTTLFAAAVAFVFGQVAEWRKNRREFRHRWDEHAYSAAQEFVSATRRLAHLAAESRSATPQLSDAHGLVRSTAQQLIVIVDTELATLARAVQREAYAVVKTAHGEPDPRPGTRSAEERYHDSLELFYVGLREYLRLAPHPQALIAD